MCAIIYICKQMQTYYIYLYIDVKTTIYNNFFAEKFGSIKFM